MGYSIKKYKNVLPGFSLSCAITLSWLGFMLILPIFFMLAKIADISLVRLVELLSSPAAISAFFITLRYALFAAFINTCIGFVIAWAITRYKFFGSAILDALVDIPFALPGAIGGIALVSVFSKNGIIGSIFAPYDVQLVYNQFGIIIGLLFITLPFTVRSIQPLIAQLDTNEEYAAYLLGAKSHHIFLKIQLPKLIPGILSGFILAFARSIGEYGTVIFVAGNIPLKSEVISRYIYNKIDQYDIEGAIASALVLLFISFLLLICMNLLHFHTWERRRK